MKLLLSLFTLVFLVNTYSQFSSPSVISPSFINPPDNHISKLVYGDLNNDGFDDFVYHIGNSFATYINNGYGDFNPISWVLAPGSIREMELFDINHDGFLDIVYCGGGLVYQVNTGTGSFSSTVESLDTYGTDAFEFGDINNDGEMDLVSTNTIGGATSFVSVLYSIGLTNQLYATIESPIPGVIPDNSYNPASLSLFDFDNNGQLDIIYSNPSYEQVYSIVNNGGGNFQGAGLVAIDGQFMNSSIFDDIDMDGNMDIVNFHAVHTTNTSLGFYDLYVSWSNNIAWDWMGTPNFTNVYAGGGDSPIPGDVFTIGAFEDINLNGYKDIVTITNDSLILIIQNAIGVFDNPIKYELLDNAEDFIFFDYDNDGDLDLVYSTATVLMKMENVFIGANRMEGTVFLDANQNGIKETGEIGLSNWKLTSTPNTQLHYSNSGGDYYFALPIGQTNTINFENNPDWTLTTGNTSFTETLTPTDTIIDSLHFGFFPNTSTTSIDPTIILEQQLCDTDASVWFTISNNGTTNPSGIISLELDDSLTYVNSIPLADSVVNNIIYWSYANLGYFSQESFQAIVHQPDFNSIGDTMSYEMNVWADNNTYHVTESFSSILVCAYDPNDKNVHPKGTGTDGLIPVNQTLEYTIRFQNTGNAPATNVIITDRLDSNLIWNSLEVVSFSHPVTTVITPTGQVEFKFLNIMLPDSSVDYYGSQGYVVYKIEPVADLAIGEIIENTADIFFDFNPEIVTNTILNTIGCPNSEITMYNGVFDCGVDSGIQWYIDGLPISGATDRYYTPSENGVYTAVFDDGSGCTSSDAFDLQNLSISEYGNQINAVAYPNPFNDFVTIKFDDYLELNTQIIISDLSGRVVFQKECSNKDIIQFKKGNLSPGIYQVSIQKDSRRIPLMKLSIY